MTLEEAAKQLEALGNPTRLNIYRYLIQAGSEGVPVGDIQRKLDIPGSTLSHHLTRLVQADLINQNRASRSLYCCANYPAMDSLISYLQYNCCKGT